MLGALRVNGLLGQSALTTVEGNEDSLEEASKAIIDAFSSVLAIILIIILLVIMVRCIYMCAGFITKRHISALFSLNSP